MAQGIRSNLTEQVTAGSVQLAVYTLYGYGSSIGGGDVCFEDDSACDECLFFVAADADDDDADVDDSDW